MNFDIASVSVDTFYPDRVLAGIYPDPRVLYLDLRSVPNLSQADASYSNLSILTVVPLRSTGITLLLHYYEDVRLPNRIV